MTTEEANKKADEYVEMFINIDYIEEEVPIEIAEYLGVHCAIKLVDELIKENESVLEELFLQGFGRQRIKIHNRLSDLQQVKEVLTNRLK